MPTSLDFKKLVMQYTEIADLRIKTPGKVFSDPNVDICYSLLFKAYSDRPYHNLLHLDEMLLFQQDFVVPIDFLRMRMEWATLWHDYEQGEDAEEKSAEACRKAFEQIWESGENRTREVNACEKLIRLTKDHQDEKDLRMSPETYQQWRAQAIFLDSDCAILSAPTARYDQYRRAVRKEYSHLTELEWTKGRTAFLEKISNSSPCYWEVPYQSLGYFSGNILKELDILRDNLRILELGTELENAE